MPPVPGISVNGNQGVLLDPCALTGLVNLNDIMEHAPSTAVIGTDATVCRGQSTNLTVTISPDGTGNCYVVPPQFNVVYSDGTSTYRLKPYVSGTPIPVTPLVTTTYSLVTVTDCAGCPTTNLSGRPVITVDTNTVHIRVLLQGPWTGSGVNMNNYLILPDLYLPLVNPYGIPQIPASLPPTFFGSNTGMVDWVAVGVKSTATGTVAAGDWVPGLLKTNGWIVALDGVSNLPMPTVMYGTPYWLVVHQRNHLGVQSSTSNTPVAILCNIDYDFTDAMSKAYPNPWTTQAPMIQLGTSLFALYAGDADQSRGVFASDWALWYNFNGLLGYYGTDMNLDSSTDSYDTNTFWAPNNGKASQAIY
jgi:hypothetical protein